MRRPLRSYGFEGSEEGVVEKPLEVDFQQHHKNGEQMGVKPLVLVIDDEIEICEILEFDFQRNGFDTLLANSSKKALEIVYTNASCSGRHIDIIISDFRMPELSGLEFVKAVRDIPNINPLIFFITGFADITLVEAKKLGVEDILLKPFNPETLVHKCKEALLQLS